MCQRHVEVFFFLPKLTLSPSRIRCVAVLHSNPPFLAFISRPTRIKSSALIFSLEALNRRPQSRSHRVGFRRRSRRCRSLSSPVFLTVTAPPPMPSPPLSLPCRVLHHARLVISEASPSHRFHLRPQIRPPPPPPNLTTGELSCLPECIIACSYSSSSDPHHSFDLPVIEPSRCCQPFFFDIDRRCATTSVLLRSS